MLFVIYLSINNIEVWTNFCQKSKKIKSKLKL